jgi:vacuolar protein-sorting-associated protein 4
MTLNEIPEPEKLSPPDVSIEDYFTAMNKIKPTVTEKDLEKQEDFTREFGQEG